MHRRTRRPEDRELDAPDEQPARAAPAAEALLAVQRSAGNHAVSALLARAPDTGRPKEKDKPKEAVPAGTRATLPDIGTIPLLSVQFGGSQPTGRRRGEEDEQQTSGEIVVSSRVGAHSQQLFKASLDGKPMTVEIVIAGSASTLRLELKGAMISSYSTGSGGGEDVETWTLNFQSMEQSVHGEAPE